MKIRQEVYPFLALSLAVGFSASAVCLLSGVKGMTATIAGAGIALVMTIYMLYFFRDPLRTVPADPLAVVAGADGKVMRITRMREDQFLHCDTVRISIFLSLFDVHVNRAPISGQSRFLGYFPGKRFFTFQEKSSDVNQHNAIMIEGMGTRCLVKQIVGPVCRRVVYWFNPEKAEEVMKGDRIGMMKFGSRLDMYFPENEVTVLSGIGDRVVAGETVIARVRKEGI